MLKQVTISHILNVLEINPKAYELIAQIEFLLRTDEERSRFLYEAIGRDGKEINKILNNIRRDKISCNCISLYAFIAECEHDEMLAIESLLQERITEAKYSKLKQSGMTPIELFSIHKRNPFARLMGILLYA
ncbi:hypothetical protein [Paenibacillus faecalis]|uniref:hypothetical protein n=1 Tax=Paenibacillus faecalis TaxID=2079532 RepID=UPI000D0F59D0|nr:hypothetical protein [Paenibacillus faecalis]